MTSSLQQRRYIAGMIKDKKDDHKYLMEIWASTPRNTDRYPDTHCDYTNEILAERLERLTAAQADYVIKAWRNEKGFKVLTARNIIHSVFN